MRITILGGEGAGSGLARRARVVLAALALADGVVPADHLAAAVWGDMLPATWPVALRGVVRELRVGLGAEVIDTVAPGYRLGPHIRSDLDDARDAEHTAAHLLAQGRAAAAVDRAEPVARLRGAQLLAGEDADWLAVHRGNVDLLAGRALDLLVAAAVQAGQSDRAVIVARRAVATDELDERGYRALITSLAGTGDRAAVVRAYEACRAQLGEQLGVEPSAETVDAYLTALGDRSTTSRAQAPRTSTTFLGRDAESTTLRNLIATPGLVTMRGRGGVGKTRLAAQAAGEPAAFDGERLWVSLGSVAQDELVAVTVALQLGAVVGAGAAVTALVHDLAPLGRTLLVLDGGELVVDGVASLASDLLEACPDLTLLVTSRVPVGVDGERTLELTPLTGSAVQLRLLRDRVTEAGGRWDEGTVHMTGLLARCGGLPLALELVAAQLTELPAGDLVDHLDQVGVDGDDHLRSLSRSSYALLAANEAALFRAFAVLDGPVGISLIRQVASALGIAPVRVVRILRELADRGMLNVDRDDAHLRYHQDDDLHRYATELLTAAGEVEAAYKALADAVRAVLPEDARAAPSGFAADVTAMLGSVRSLFAAAVAGRTDRGRCLELAFRLHRYFAATNVAEGRFWLTRLLDALPDGEWAPYALFALGYLGYWAGEIDDAVERLSASVELFGHNPTPYTARALIYLAGMLDDADRGAQAVEYIARSIGAAAHFDVDLQVSAAMATACVLGERGDPAAAGHAGDAIELCRHGGTPDQLAITLPTAAMVCWQVGAYDQCRGYLAEAQPATVGVHRISRAVLLSTAAGLAFAEADFDAAVEFAEQADAEASALGVDREIPLIRAVLARALLDRGNQPAARAAALAALDAAGALAYDFPYAVCLETAALVAAASDAQPAGSLATVLATAAALRERGARPAAPALASAVADLRARLGPGTAVPVAAAASLCRPLLTG